MVIAVNCWVLRNKQLDGIGNFTVETFARLIPANPGITFLMMVDKNFTEDYFNFPNVKLHRVFPPYRHPALYLLYMETVVPAFLRKHSPDLFLSMDGFLSLRTSCPQLPVIYDLNFEHYPQDLKWKNRVYFRTFFKRFARKATRIATISEYSKADIVKWYGIDPLLIDNVSCGIKEKFSPLSNDAKRLVKQRYSANEDYFFFIGSMHPRKNIVRLIEAFDLFKKGKASKMKLVLGGHILWDDDSIKTTMDRIASKDDVVFTGRLSDEELKNLLGAALALTFVPTFEGFGLPIVEAFQAEVPVICSNTTSMPEVAGDAAILVDPFSVKEIAEAMKKMVTNEALRNELIERGKSQKEKFTWQKTAAMLHRCITEAVRK